VQAKTVLPIVKEQVEQGATIHTDEFPVYNGLERMGYAHKKVWLIPKLLATN
jgi:transposase-like protein